MSFAEARIEEYLISKASGLKGTEVPFTVTQVGDLEIVILATTSELPTHDLSEEEIERNLAKQDVIRVPQMKGRTSSEFQRVDVAGEPISEMIINERR